jgi:hypothetical protein
MDALLLFLISILPFSLKTLDTALLFQFLLNCSRRRMDDKNLSPNKADVV